MRWRFTNPKDPEEVAARSTTIQQIDEWWEEFSRKAEALNDLFAGRTRWDLPAWMQQHLQAINPNLMWEYGAAVQGDGHRLVITPESETHLRPMVETLLARAPEIPGWEFYGYRLAENVEMAGEMTKARVQGNLQGTVVSAKLGPSHLIDLCYYSPGITSHEQARKNAFVVSEAILGEEILDKWIGCIEAKSLPQSGGLSRLFRKPGKTEPRHLALERLKPTIDAIISSVKEQLPDKPLYLAKLAGELTDGVVIKMQSDPADDYPRKDDLITVLSLDSQLWQALHASAPFYSERYSRHGETFCYVKIDGSEGLDEEGFPDRGSIEDALDEVLTEAQAGCVIGGGTGLRYSYIDLALADVEASVPVITGRLRSGKVPKRSWLLFFDAPLAHEWVGVYDDSPAPCGF